MSARSMIERRRLLLGAMGFGLSLGFQALDHWSWISESRYSDSSRLAHLWQYQPSARVLGQEYLRVTPAEAKQKTLTALVVNRLPAKYRTLSAVTDRQLRDHLLAAARRDFIQARTVQLDGWMMSLTEARLCAIATLEPMG